MFDLHLKVRKLSDKYGGSYILQGKSFGLFKNADATKYKKSMLRGKLFLN